MRIAVLGILMLTLTGCGVGPSEGSASAVVARLEQPMIDLAVAASGTDLAAIRAAARDVIAIYDAGTGPQ